jgi:hypothetical protein
MKFKDIPADILTIRIRRTDNATEALQEQPVFSVDPNPIRPNEFEIRLSDAVINARPIVASDIRRLNSELASGRAILGQLANPAADGSIELQIAFFAGECLEMGGVEIGVDEYVENRIADIERRKDRIKGDHLHKMLGQLCCFRQADTAFFFLTAGPAIDSALKPEPASKEHVQKAPGVGIDKLDSEKSQDDAESVTNLAEEAQTQKPQPSRENSFCVSGDGIRFVATETNLPDGKSIYTITRLTKRKGESDRALRLAKGRLTFVDWTQAGRIQILTKAQMSAITKEDGSYLKKWDEFGDLEGELLLKKAREVGVLQYTDMKQHRDGSVTVRISQASDSALIKLAAGGVESVEMVEALPDYLVNLDLKFADFAKKIEGEYEQQELLANGKKRSPISNKESNSNFAVKAFDETSNTLTLATESMPKKFGTLILSLAGNITQIKRRIHARRSILEGRTANPQLGLLIEENGKIGPTRRPQKIRPLTAFVRGKIFQNPPTFMQERAIEVALNTPDIALIQGPPGTGKTTVIAAILERLNELADKRGATIKGQVLLTGFQHDAVENIIDRISLNCIPVPKFGKRSGANEDDFSVFEKNLEDWCRKLAAELHDRIPQIEEIKRETEIKNLCLQYLQFPTRALAATLAEKIEALGVTILGEDAARRAANLAKNLSREERLNDESNRLLNVVRCLRTRPESFADDGSERATDALDDLRDALKDRENELALLDAASLWRSEDGVPPFLKDLATLKRNLLTLFSNPPIFRVEKQNDEVIALAEEAFTRIRTVGVSASDKKSAALAEFLTELENNPYGMIDAVSDYSFAFAATCQQSVNKQMQRQKGITDPEGEQKIEYEFVIVDEAARVSPRDLMIPMAQGKRIILVGDHRQLPHIVDEAVIKALSEEEVEDLLAKEGENERDSKNWSNISLFEHMFVNRLSSLEDQDGITRRVTLDTQYRMHPFLGDFISRNFYERFDPMEKFASGRPPSDFTHDLPDTHNMPAIWLDVPAAKGNHKRSGTSWTRPAEATAIAKQLQKWVDSAEDLCPSLSFSKDDFADLFSLSMKLRQQLRPVDAWLSKQLSDDTQTALMAYDGQGSAATRLLELLAQEFDSIIKQSSVYENTRFDGVAIRPAIQSILAESPKGDNLCRLNRLLIEDAYPLEFRRKPLTYGVISFYKAQAEFIKKQLGKLAEDDKKIRIGTVDSFQGMEFDVVFLSMVRTFPQKWTARDSNRETQARQLFGHLCLYNRLNVSMSRQKKLLVVSGDSGLLENDLAEEFVPGLVDFLRLCKTEGRVL